MKNPKSGIQRIKNLLIVGAAPSAAVGLASDFIAPKGGWMIALALGAIAIFLALVAVLYYGAGTEKFKNSWIYRLTEGDTDLEWIWDGTSFLKIHGIQIAAIFSTVCFLLASKSYAASDTGGYLGTNFRAAATLQESLGLLSKNQAETNSALIELTRIVKKETSDDPRKELQNLGIGWSDNDLASAIERHDKRAVALLYQSEVFVREDFQNRIALKILESTNSEIPGIATHYSKPLSEENCKKFSGNLIWDTGKAMASFLGGGGGTGARSTNEVRQFVNSKLKINYLEAICGKGKIIEFLSVITKQKSKPDQENVKILIDALSS